MSNTGGRVSPDYLADIAPEYAEFAGGWFAEDAECFGAGDCAAYPQA